MSVCPSYLNLLVCLYFTEMQFVMLLQPSLYYSLNFFPCLLSYGAFTTKTCGNSHTIIAMFIYPYIPNWELRYMEGSPNFEQIIRFWLQYKNKERFTRRPPCAIYCVHLDRSAVSFTRTRNIWNKTFIQN
jgi:hypothetical protein